jgi:hypothetical protein
MKDVPTKSEPRLSPRRGDRTILGAIYRSPHCNYAMAVGLAIGRVVSEQCKPLPRPPLEQVLYENS